MQPVLLVTTAFATVNVPVVVDSLMQGNTPSAGGGAMYVSPPLLVMEPSGVVTVMSTVEPFWPAGTTAEIRRPLSIWNDVAATDPKVTLVAPTKPAPRMVMVSPPELDAVFGSIREIVGVIDG